MINWRRSFGVLAVVLPVVVFGSGQKMKNTANASGGAGTPSSVYGQFDSNNFIGILKEEVSRDEKTELVAVTLRAKVDGKRKDFQFQKININATIVTGDTSVTLGRRGITNLFYATQYKVWIISDMGRIQNRAILLDLRTGEVLKSYRAYDFLPVRGSEHILFTQYSLRNRPLFCDGVLVWPRKNKLNSDKRYFTEISMEQGGVIVGMNEAVEREMTSFRWLSPTRFVYRENSGCSVDELKHEGGDLSVGEAVDVIIDVTQNSPAEIGLRIVD